jgi:L-alanine-DL-glutamate epimerase-like enolase superfamily enzyme
MNRRQALRGIAALASTAAWDMTGGNPMGCGDPPAGLPADFADLGHDVRITAVTGFRLVSNRPKLVGKNSHLDVHGRTGSDFVWLVETSAGVQGIGVGPDNAETAMAVLGKKPTDYYRLDARMVESPLGRQDMPLWDLVAKLLDRPAYALFGGKGPERVPVYDGSIYFADLLPEYESRGIARILEEIDQGLARGHRAFKVKVGRGWKWMGREPGDRRDIEVLQAIRKHVGPDVLLFIDANNGYDLPGTKRFFEAIGPLDIGFAEEMFPEVVEEDLEFKKFLMDHGWKTLVADGESAREPQHFEPFVQARALDIMQPDMKAFGFNLQLQMDRMLQGTPMRLAPHNWGSLLGFYMQLHLGRGIGTFFRAEHDPLTSELLSADGYQIIDGAVRVPEAPGFGLVLNREALAAQVKPAWQVKS